MWGCILTHVAIVTVRSNCTCVFYINHPVDLYTVTVRGLSVWGVMGAMVLGWGHSIGTTTGVLLYELYYRSVREIRRQYSHIAQTVKRSKFNENTLTCMLQSL